MSFHEHFDRVLPALNNNDVDKLLLNSTVFHLQHEEFGSPEGLHEVGDY